MEADYGVTQFAMDAERGRAFNDDDRLIVNFHMAPYKDKEASRVEGRPIFVSKEFVTILVPGDKNNVVRRPVWEQDKTRFPRQYQAFKNNQEQQMAGTPLEQVPWITREQVEELKFFHIRTLENLANLSDTNAQKFMGINKLRQRARDHIEAAKDAAPQAQLRAELDKRDEQLRMQNELITNLTARLEKLETEEKGKAAKKG